MGLLRFHQILIFTGMLFCIFFSYWEFSDYSVSGVELSLYLGIVSVVCFILLTVYFFYLIRYIRKLGE